MWPWNRVLEIWKTMNCLPARSRNYAITRAQVIGKRRFNKLLRGQAIQDSTDRNPLAWLPLLFCTNVHPVPVFLWPQYGDQVELLTPAPKHQCFKKPVPGKTSPQGPWRRQRKTSILTGGPACVLDGWSSRRPRCTEVASEWPQCYTAFRSWACCKSAFQWYVPHTRSFPGSS